MPILLMLFLTLVCFPELTDWPEPLFTAAPLTCAALGWLALGVPVAYAAIASRRAAARLDADVGRRDRVLRRYERRRGLHQVLLFAAFGGAIWPLGWGWAVNELWRAGGELLPGAELVLLAPFLAALCLSWAFFYDADRASFRAAQRLVGLDPLARALLQPGRGTPEYGGRAAYVAFHVRQKLALLLLPVALLLAPKEVQRHFPEVWDEWSLTVNAATFLVVLGVFALMPVAVRLVLGLRPLPPGPLRDRLLAAARRLRFRCSDVLVWNTNGGMANAMVVGFLPWLRYVVFTDRLLEEFTPAEVEAVFGHEVGHIKHHHMLYYFFFLVGSMAVLGTVATEYLPELAAAAAGLTGADPGGATIDLGGHRLLQAVLLVGCLAAYLFVVFGFLSRRCERQADVYGCRAVSCGRSDCSGEHAAVAVTGAAAPCPAGVRTFTAALEKVAAVNGLSRDRPGFLQSWQHSTIARRVEFLQRLLDEPALEARFQRRVALVKWGLFVALGLVLLLILHTNGWSI